MGMRAQDVRVKKFQVSGCERWSIKSSQKGQKEFPSKMRSPVKVEKHRFIKKPTGPIL